MSPSVADPGAQYGVAIVVVNIEYRVLNTKAINVETNRISFCGVSWYTVLISSSSSEH